MGWLGWVLTRLGGTYLLICLAAYLFQSHLIWFPSGPPTETPARFGLAYRDVELRTRDDVRLHAWLLPAERPRGIVVVCHGNGGNIGAWLNLARYFTRLRCSVLLFDYRGYGGSGGSPSEEGTYLDAEAAWEYATQVAAFPAERVIAWGWSLGGAVAVELARRHPVAALVTESTFTSLADAGAHLHPWLPVRWLLRARYDTFSKVGEIRVPWLVLHSTNDPKVPFEEAERLVAEIRRTRAAKPGVAAVEFVATGDGHNGRGVLDTPAARVATETLFDRVLPAVK